METFRWSQLFNSIKEYFWFTRKSKSPSPEEIEISLIKIISNYGVIELEASASSVVYDVKKVVLEEISETAGFPVFSDLEAIDDMIRKFKLIRVKSNKQLSDSDLLKDLQVLNNEEFLLILQRCTEQYPSDISEILAGPSERKILEKTAHIAQSPQSPPAFHITDLLNDDDMRKVFVSLAQEAAYVLGMTNFADKLIVYHRQRIHNYIKNHSNATMVMVQLGFPTERVKYAMKLKANHYNLALDWLIEHEPSTGYDENRKPWKSPRTSLISSSRRGSILSSKFSPSGHAQDRVDGLLEIVKFYAEKDELVYEVNIKEMLQMGYKDEEAREALQVTRNNVSAAVDFIHGDNSPSITELRDGLASSSDIRKKFFESPEIQTSLGKPKFFRLFINILDNPSQANAWSHSSEIGALMTYTIMSYHEQKYACATNQFNESRPTTSVAN